MSFDCDFTQGHLEQMVPGNANIDHWYEALEKILPEYEINTKLRVAMFVAQCAHESGGFKFVQENLNYRWQTLRKLFPKYFTTDEIAQDYASRPNKQAAIANRIYSNRMGNGNEDSGDGFRYCGRGLIQLTGKNNYTMFAGSLGISVEEASEYMQTFEGAVQAGAWFWEVNELNLWCDRSDVLTVTKKINGGTIGLEDRIKHYNHALHVLTH